MLRNLSDWVVGTARIVNRITGLKTIARRRSVRSWNVECLEVRSMLSHILGTAESFAVLGGQSVTNTGPSVISGNLGVSPGSSVTGFPPGLVINGTMHVTDAVAGQAQSDLTTAYNVVAGTAITADLTGQDLGGLTLTPGVYFFSTSAQLTGTLTLDSQGNPNAKFFFQTGSTLTTASNSTVKMLNNGSPCEVFWQIGSSATLGTDTQFVGHILALTSITLNSRASVEGSVLARNGSVTLDDNFVSMATCVPGSISGMKFNDLNGDGIRQGGESGLPGLVVFLDYNGNGLLDAGEDSATTNAGGNYTFADLNAGTYRVRQSLQAGLVQTTSNPADIVLPPGGDVTGVDFGDFQRISISGSKFRDTDGDGVRDPGELGLAGVTIFVDADNDGVLDLGESFTTTDANGNYSFTNLGPGTYRIREVPPVSFTQTTPNPPPVVASSGTNITGQLFGNFQSGSFQNITIGGTKFGDTDGDGVRDPGELGQAGVTIFLDADNDGVLDLGESFTTTDANGNYTFTNLGPGTYNVHEVLPVGTVQTTVNPAPVVASSGANVTGQLFGNFKLISINGSKFQDTDGDGVRDPGEQGLAGVTIFIDTDNDGVRDLGETFTTTNANGSYTIANLGPGTYNVREVLPVGSVQTTPNSPPVVASSGANVTGQLFGNFQRISINGTKFRDTDGDGVRDPGELGLAGVAIFIDSDNDGIRDLGELFTTTDANGNYTFTNLGPGTYNVREVLPVGTVQTTMNPLPVVATSGTNITGQLLGNFQLISIGGSKFRDTDGDGVRDPGELGLAGVTIFIDTDNDGVRGIGETFTSTDANGNYTFTNLGPGTYNVREVLPVGTVQTTVNPPSVVATSGANLTGQLFGNFQRISINGTKFRDTDGDGIRDPGELGLAGVTIFLDTDIDGIRDLGEAFTSTDASGSYTFANLGPGTYNVREVVPVGSAQTTSNPIPVVATSGTNITGQLFGNFRLISINGTKFLDSNGNGVRDPGDVGLAGVTIFLDADNDGVRDLGETFSTTDASGNYTFTNLGPGTYKVREEVPVGSVQTTSNPTPIVASSGSNITGQLFGNFQLNTINGSKFRDANGNGFRDPGDVGLAGFVIFLDTDNDGVLDPGEQNTTSDTNGNFRFTSVGLGTYRVREVGQLDFVQMTNNPSVIVVTTSGANVTGLLFGNIPVANLVVISKLLFTGQNLINLRNGTFARQANFVAGLYQSLLGRAPDLAGLRKYLRLLQSGFSQTRVIAMFRADFRV